MRKKYSRKKLLTAAVMAALLTAPGYGHAFIMEPEYVYSNGKPIVEMQFLTQGGRLYAGLFPDPAGEIQYVLLDGDDRPESEK